MKKKVSAILLTSMLLGVLCAQNASALDYKWRLGNEASFEMLEDVHASLGETANPLLDDYPAGCTYVYRSADLYGVTAASRMNTNIVVFADDMFESKEDAYAYLEGLGLIDIIDKAVGSVVLMTPAEPVTVGFMGSVSGGWDVAMARNYYKVQTAQYNSSFAEGSYFPSFGYQYIIGIGKGATFVNTYIAPAIDYIGRVAGMLLIGGDMNTELYDVPVPVPAYLVNADEDVIAEYAAANEADAVTVEDGKCIRYNQQFPVRRVVSVAMDEVDEKALIEDVYNNFFIKAMRIPVLQRGVNSAGTAQCGYGFDEAPFSLFERAAIIDGKTEDGIVIIPHVEERFNDAENNLVALTGEYLQTWFELLPEEVLDGTAAEHSVPLWLANHGGGDDPVQFCDEIGLLDLAGKERFAMVAPYYQSMYAGFFGGGDDPVPMCRALCAIVHYMLDTYPALDPSRVYVTGYSLGGGATFHAIMEEPGLFAAAIPMSAAGYEGNDEQKANYETCDLPLLLTTSTFDLGGAFNTAEMTISTAYQDTMNRFLGFDGMEGLEYDFEKYPISGFAGDLYTYKVLNGEYNNYSWFQCREDGAPMVGVSYTANLVHALYPEFANIAWDWAKHFSRDQETGEVVYTAALR